MAPSRRARAGAHPEIDVKAGKERSRREQSEMDRALEAARARGRGRGAVDAAEGSAVEATSTRGGRCGGPRGGRDRAVAAAAGARSHAAGSCRTATATAVDALDKAGQTEPPTAEPTDGAAAAPQPSVPPSSGTKKAGRLPKEVVPNERDWAEFRAKRDAAPPPPPAPVPPLPLSFATEPEPTEPPPISTPAVELAPPAAARAPSPAPVAPDEPPMDTTPPPPLSDDDDAPAASAMDVDAPADAGETTGVLERLRNDMVRTVDIASRNMRPPNVDWRIGHTYSFLGAMEALGAGDTRAALAEALTRGQRGELEPSTVRRAVARILGGNLRTLERFQHTLRPTAAPITSAATVSWYDPASGVDLYAYSSCGAAAKEWGLTTELVRDCVEGNVDWNGLHFRRQTRWPVPAGSERVSQGVLRETIGTARSVRGVSLATRWWSSRSDPRSSVGRLRTRGASSRRTLGRRRRRQGPSSGLLCVARDRLGTSFPSAFAVRKHRVRSRRSTGPTTPTLYLGSGEIAWAGTGERRCASGRGSWWDPRDPSGPARSGSSRAATSHTGGYHYQLVRRWRHAAVMAMMPRRAALAAHGGPGAVAPAPVYASAGGLGPITACDKWRVLPATCSAPYRTTKCGARGVLLEESRARSRTPTARVTEGMGRRGGAAHFCGRHHRDILLARGRGGRTRYNVAGRAAAMFVQSLDETEDRVC